jgi:hypothetical protein
VHVALNLGVAEDLLDGLRNSTELLETGMGKESVEVDALEKESISMEVWVAKHRRAAEGAERRPAN